MNSDYCQRFKFIFHCSIILFFVFISFETVGAQTLWSGATYGMSPETVLSTVKNSRRIENGRKLDNGFVELIVVDDVEINKEHLKASFFFNAKKLASVNLVLKEEGSFNIMLNNFDQFRTILRSKYGKEIDVKINPDSVFATAEATWTSGKTTILLAVISYGNKPASLNILYSMRLSKEAEKL